MAEMNVDKDSRRLFKARYRGRFAQIWIYLARQLAMFTYQSDWKVLPMSALIAGLVGMVIRNRLFVNMEGTLLGGFAMVMVCIWNGCFNSIQVICRERDVVKREHRSGMHISSYVISHMLYQMLMCLLQTVVTLYVTKAVGVKYPAEGLFTNWMIVDFGISIFLITYASDMMALWISALCRNTTTAMTIMPFVLIFQLVFSGGLMTLPGWTRHLTPFTISNPALKVVAAQGDYNNRPMMVIWNQLDKLRDRELSATVNVGQLIDALMDTNVPAINQLHETPLTRVFTLGEVRDVLQSEQFKPFKQEQLLEEMSIGDILRFVRGSEAFASTLDYTIDLKIFKLNLKTVLDKVMADEKIMAFLDSKQVIPTTTVGDVLNMVNAEGLLEKYRDVKVGKDIFVGDVLKMLVNSEMVQSYRDQSYTYTTTVGGIVDMIGEDRIRDILQKKIAEASYNADYDCTQENVMRYWLRLSLFALVFAVLSTITLEFIDKDKR